MSRIAIPKKIRFEILKRDKFTCQYCGAQAPTTLLHLDHIDPVANGGGNEITNLITACQPCNAGKSNIRLDDSSLIQKRRKQLEELEERREQIEMMFEWQKSLEGLDEDVVTKIAKFWEDLTICYPVNERGLGYLNKVKNKYEVGEILLAFKTSCDHYLVWDNDKPTLLSAANAWCKMEAICYNNRLEKDFPKMSQVSYIHAILMNKFNYVHHKTAKHFIKRAIIKKVSVTYLKEHAKCSKNWTDWKRGMEDILKNPDVVTETQNT